MTMTNFYATFLWSKLQIFAGFHIILLCRSENVKNMNALAGNETAEICLQDCRILKCQNNMKGTDRKRRAEAAKKEGGRIITNTERSWNFQLLVIRSPQ